MKALSGSRFNALWLVLVAVMIATRFKHIGDALHLPDASMALFFLGGLYLRRHWTFVVMVLLAVALDWFSISYAGVSSFCVTLAYSFLPLSYAVLWYAGRWFAPRMDGRAMSFVSAFAVAFVAASLSFAISNGSFYWLGGRYTHPNMAEYVSRLWQWGPVFVRTTIIYVAVALVVHAVASRLASLSSAHREGI